MLSYSTGRRKCAVAQLRFFSGNGKIVVNGCSLDYYFQHNSAFTKIIRSPLKLLNLELLYDFIIVVKGGGLSGQAGAIRLAIARVLAGLSPSNRSSLKSKRYLTRDSRIKERKKYGLKKARKAPQFSKR
uniref:Small ribosomal subunit protein uS9c n=1 Tax=Cyanidium caldarium TaxID=2771 RepID=RR9_CYACA|nr:ribosomal protein S9 [Cyanidium caldarium]Q9TLV4.1 RecName: Full=Small ribosomal subunit protein uS9c; AltName: Full=30S ribosomal protein S9, chloroplastic [Cyanidium caldarium]AAF12930.1 unknown [Cyanidium caldarium]WDB00289.1 ribosomal protein S9 [Cyanidium caldarium]